MSYGEIPKPEYWEEAVKQYPLLKDLSLDPRLLGTKANLCPFPQHNTSQRMSMFSSNIVQAPIPEGAEIPAVCSGFERHFMDYTFNDTRMTQAGTTIAYIQKYRTHVGQDPIKFSPSAVLVYIGDEDGLVHCMEITRYTKCSEGFGYPNIVKEQLLREGIGIPAGTVIAHSPAVQNSKYCLGVNANVCYMSAKETVEDAFVISDELARKFKSTGIRTLVIDIDKNMVPLNLYSEDNIDYKFMPDLHERVRDDGIICAFRTVDDASMISDMTDRALCQPQHPHDEVKFAEAGAVIIDIDVFRNGSGRSPQYKTPPHMFAQLDKYISNGLDFHRKVVDVYHAECVKKGRDPAPEFVSLVTRSMSILAAAGNSEDRSRTPLRTAPKFSFKGEQIKFIRMVITYKYDNTVSLGHKTSGREGAKGVISAIVPKKHMPVDGYGNVADIVISSETPINRMNYGQLYEQHINFIASRVLAKYSREAYEERQRMDGLIEFYADVNPSFADIVANNVETPRRVYTYLRELDRRGWPVIVAPPGLDRLRPSWVRFMQDKYQAIPTPVSFDLLRFRSGGDPEVIRRVHTYRPVMIAKKYIYILCKIPHARSCGMTYVNQIGAPVRSKAKAQSPLGLVPIRIGEDENRNLAMAIGNKLAYRLLSIYANSPTATDELAFQLLTSSKPTRLDWLDMNDELISRHNVMGTISRHMLATCGIDISPENTMLRKDEEARFRR